MVYRRRQWHPTPVLLPGKSYGQRSLAGCSPWGCEESDRTARLHFHFSFSCIGEGSGNPLQYSCLGEPGGLPSMGVTQSRTRLKRLSSSSSRWYILKISNSHFFIPDTAYLDFQFSSVHLLSRVRLFATP